MVNASNFIIITIAIRLCQSVSRVKKKSDSLFNHAVDRVVELAARCERRHAFHVFGATVWRTHSTLQFVERSNRTEMVRNLSLPLLLLLPRMAVAVSFSLL